MSNELDQRLSDFIEKFGTCEVIAFLERREPPDRETFIQRLYSDVHNAVEELQSLAHELEGENENKLRSRLLTILKTLGYRVAAESDNRGHTDLLVENSHIRLKWIGEAKKHSGTAYSELRKGMRQLHTRYSSGTHADMGLIVFVFTKNAAGVVQAWKAILEESALCGLQGNPHDDPEVPLSFWTDHMHEGSGLPVRTKHIFAALHYRPMDK